ncbi:MAG: gliding motility-associated C-terminal domain-containing protein, partial [Bacteroidota bacterium]
QLNDRFNIISGIDPVQQWAIYDRWGQVYFASSTSADSWSGEGAPEGVYICRVVYIIQEGETLEKIGRVTLVR